MKPLDCTHQAAVRRAAAGGNFDPDLAAHLGRCAVCQETLRVAGSLHRLAASDQPTLPAAGQIWWKAQIIRQLMERDKRAHQAVRPILWGQAIALLVLAGGLLVPVSSVWLLGGPLGQLTTASAWLPVIVAAVLAPLLGLVALIFVWREA